MLTGLPSQSTPLHPNPKTTKPRRPWRCQRVRGFVWRGGERVPYSNRRPTRLRNGARRRGERVRFSIRRQPSWGAAPRRGGESSCINRRQTRARRNAWRRGEQRRRETFVIRFSAAGRFHPPRSPAKRVARKNLFLAAHSNIFLNECSPPQVQASRANPQELSNTAERPRSPASRNSPNPATHHLSPHHPKPDTNLHPKTTTPRMVWPGPTRPGCRLERRESERRDSREVFRKPLTHLYTVQPSRLFCLFPPILTHFPQKRARNFIPGSSRSAIIFTHFNPQIPPSSARQCVPASSAA